MARLPIMYSTNPDGLMTSGGSRVSSAESNANEDLLMLKPTKCSLVLHVSWVLAGPYLSWFLPSAADVCYLESILL